MTDIAGLHCVSVKRRGQPVRWYVYAWRGGPKIMATVGGAKPALDAAALAAYQEAVKGRDQPAESTLAALAAKWRASASWAALAPATRTIWGQTLSRIVEKWGEVPVRIFDSPRTKAKIIDWRDGMAAKPRSADYHVQVLRGLLAFGKLRGELAANIAEGIPAIYKGGQRETILWTPAEVEQWQAAPWQVADAFNLARLTGLRRADLVAVPWEAVGEHAIVWRTSKSGRRSTVSCPMLPALRELLDRLRERPRAEGVQTLLVNSLGQPWTPGGLTASFTIERNRLGLPDKHLHDARGTWCTQLCEAELTDQQISDLMGWPVDRVATIRRVYVDGARTVVAIGERLAKRAL